MADIQIDEKILTEYPEVGNLDKGLLRQAIRRAVQYHPGDEATGLTVLITADEMLQQLNKTYLGEDRPTDVLAFPSGDYDPEHDVKYLGDVVISYPRAAAQARAAGHEPFDEIRLLVIHGILHLLGYDHGDQAARAEMWAVQETILSELGITLTIRE